LGAKDILEDGKIHDDYRIDYLRSHINACKLAIEDGVEMIGYCPWSFTDLLSSSQGFNKRYGLVYINRTDHEILDLKRIKKDSFYWYKEVIENNGIVK
ncbi:TPA: glycoside hydrolase family 1 protein, partial [Clostridioides difficile]|nr:glycoside hydrolase family 1 protein [Clostridioides difficile]HBY2604537.1 glycoside hydrolase family 1 protein [Clostridioides difficile]HBY2703400.1 glycoside hydrolase family 1 protein [Clostridioides difficile]HBY2848805.1 glycoside hydrolase family 1 protein [Clostridioides difficile]HBY2891313.1 glycoside hydrolase family 1 protein [Clostridioides difficile]